MRLLIPVFLIATLTLCSCYRNESVVCYDEPVDMQLAGFDSSELSSVAFAHYRKNGRFDSLLGSFNLGYGNYFYSQPGNYYGILSIISTDSVDIQVTINATGQQFRITDIMREAPHGETIKQSIFSKVQYVCINKFLSYRLNGVPVSMDGAQYIRLQK